MDKEEEMYKVNISFVSEITDEVVKKRLLCFYIEFIISDYCRGKLQPINMNRKFPLITYLIHAKFIS